MDATSLRQFLRSLCHDLQWEYAVFWKLKHQSRMLLTWEDGYCNCPKPREFVEGMSDNVHLGETTGVTSFDYEIDGINGISAGYPVELAVASMSCLLYSLGEGYVGSVASTGKHCWIFADEFNSRLLPEYPNELHLQFAVGIKTILLVPVIPHGVVQLGSLQKVNEDPALVAHIRDMFNTFQCNLGESMLSTVNRDISSPSSSLTSSLLEKIITSANSCNILNPIQAKMEEKNPMALDDIQVTSELSKCFPDMKFQFIGQDNLQVQGNDIDNIRNTGFGDLPMGSSAISFQNQILSGNCFKMMEPDAPTLSCVEENLRFSFQCDSTELRFGSHTNMGMNVYPYDGMMDQQFGEETSEVTDQIISEEFFNFPAESELHKALGSALQKRCNEYLSNPNFVCEDVYSSSTPSCHTDFIGGIEPSVGESHEFFVKDDDADNLLDEMLSSMYDASGDISYTRSNSIRSPTISSGQIAASSPTQSRSRCSVLGENDSAPWNSVGTGFVPGHENVITRSPTKPSLKNTRSSLIDEERQKALGCTQSRKSTKISHTGQKKVGHSDVQRPRPRDRQMIQDRVKVLRELVPNSAKCSIDSLLDQTIKHMLFLRSVTNRAEKLKQCGYTEAVDRRNWKSSENQGPDSGASWAFELGNRFGMCPIIVKDLEQPGHMLIEMLCEENGLFLEIAQVIRRLELTILKGVMQNRMDKSWAHFIVEASTGFRRMDIFWPLMQLLQRNSSISSMI